MKIHATCGGLVRWYEAVTEPGVGHYGECLECGADELAVEEIIPLELPDGVRQAEEAEYWNQFDLEDLALLEWDDRVDWQTNQHRFREALS